jgi:hypothetical protein
LFKYLKINFIFFLLNILVMSTLSKSKLTSHGGARKAAVRKSTSSSHTSKRRTLPKVKRNMSLRSYGYRSSLPSKDRKMVLMRIIRHEDPLAVARRLQLIANYVRVTDPVRYLIYKNDAGMLLRLYQSLRDSHSSGLVPTHRVVRRKRVVKRKAAPRRRVVKRR